MLRLAGKQLAETAAKSRAWAHKNPWRFFLLVAALVAFLWVLFQTIRADRMGLRAKTFWDWLDLLIVPVVLAAGAWWLNRGEKQAEREAAEKRAQTERGIALDRQHQATLEAYFDRMTELLLEKELGQDEGGEAENKPEADLAVSIARARTLAVLRTLDSGRVSAVFRFLRETQVGNKTLAEVVPLDGGDLTRVKWCGRVARLHEADLSGIDLSGADLSKAILYKSYLVQTILYEANLHNAFLNGSVLASAMMMGANLTDASLARALLLGASLRGANLSGASLRWANLSGANLSGAKLVGAKYNSATVWPDGFDPAAAGAVLVEDEDFEEE